MLRALTALAPIFLLIACGQGGPDSEDSQQLTYYQDIQPLVGQHCLRCHSEGGIGTGDFTDPDVVQALAERMAVRVEDGSMPPGVSDPDCRDYVDSEWLSLSEEDRARFMEWGYGDAAMGEPEGSSVEAPITPELEDPDLILRAKEPFVPNYDPEEQGNEYSCVVLDFEREENVWINAMHPVFDHIEIAHHTLLYRADADRLGESQLSGEPFSCSELPQGATELLGGWGPGASPLELPEGTGIQVSPEDRFIFQVHYYAATPEQQALADQPGYAFRLQEEAPEKIVYLYDFGEQTFTIPAGASDHSHVSSLTWPEGYPDITILSALPHMHVLGTAYRMWIERDDEEVCLLESDNYDFENQINYLFKDPITVTTGDRLHFECRWDNSADNPDQIYDQPQEIRYGPNTEDEMCFSFVLLTF